MTMTAPAQNRAEANTRIDPKSIVCMPGRKIIKTPMNPQTTADQRRKRARSPRMMVDKMTTKMGEVKNSAVTLASEINDRARKKHSIAEMFNMARNKCFEKWAVRICPKPDLNIQGDSRSSPNTL